jgi:predicted phosphodiesterase
MKIAVCSDLHLEFDTLTLENTENAQVLILGGDICVAADLMDKDDAGIFDRFDRSRGLHEFFQMCCRNFSHVVYIAGNHEHYNGDYAKTFEILRTRLAYLPNLHILDKEVFVLDDITFIGGTLWTDMNQEDSMTLRHIKGMMNDFRCVKNSNREVSFKDYEGKFQTRAATFCPEDAVTDHKKMLQYIDVVTQVLGKNTNKYVVVGHHAPSKASTHPRYKNEELMNGAYSSDLNDFILDRPCIKLWTHGHTHEDFDYLVGSTRVVCNPRGYANYEDRADHFKLKFVEV